MKKNTFIIVTLIVITLLITLVTIYVIDKHKINNNKPVLFSTWRYDYLAPEENNNETKQVSKLELMYQTIIDNIISQDQGLNNDAKYISLDIDSFVVPIERGKGNIQSKYLGLEETEKATLLKYCKKYNSNIKDYSMQELKDNGLYDEENIKIDGILIFIENVEKITENSAIMTVGKYRSGLRAIFPKYKLTYKNGDWDIKILEMAIS